MLRDIEFNRPVPVRTAMRLYPRYTYFVGTLQECHAVTNSRSKAAMALANLHAESTPARVFERA